MKLLLKLNATGPNDQLPPPSDVTVGDNARLSWKSVIVLFGSAVPLADNSLMFAIEAAEITGAVGGVSSTIVPVTV